MAADVDSVSNCTRALNLLGGWFWSPPAILRAPRLSFGTMGAGEGDGEVDSRRVARLALFTSCTFAIKFAYSSSIFHAALLLLSLLPVEGCRGVLSFPTGGLGDGVETASAGMRQSAWRHMKFGDLIPFEGYICTVSWYSFCQGSDCFKTTALFC